MIFLCTEDNVLSVYIKSFYFRSSAPFSSIVLDRLNGSTSSIVSFCSPFSFIVSFFSFTCFDFEYRFYCLHVSISSIVIFPLPVAISSEL
jgi:hypothetical protein